MDITDRFALPLSDTPPCGPNLEYDSAFLALEAMAATAPERAIGDAVREAEEPDWRDVARQAEALLDRTRDVRVGAHLAKAWLRTGGLLAWSRAVGLVRGWLEAFWDEVHPVVDEGDAIERINAVGALAAADDVMPYLRRTQVLRVERIGSFTLRDLRIMSGSLKGTEDAPVRADASPDDIEAVVSHVDEATLRDTVTAVSDVLAHLDAIDGIFAIRTPGQGPDFDGMRRELRELDAFLRAALARRFPGMSSAGVDGTPDEGTAGTIADASTGPQSRGPIRGPDDVRRLIDEICAWYAVHEPSSPVRPILRRAHGLVGLGFAELLKALAPGGLSEFQNVAGDDEVA